MNSIHCFAIKRGELERRLNSDFYHPERLTTIIALKDKWRANELRKISEVIIEHNEQYNISIEDEYLGLANIKAGLGIVDLNASEEAAGKCKRFEKNWILYGKLRPYLNKVLLTSKSGQCSTEFYTLSIRDEHTIRIDFLHSFLSSQLLLNQSIHLMTGNTHPRILWEDFQEILIPIPPMEQQINLSRAIVNARNNYTSKSEQAEELLKGLDEYILAKLGIDKSINNNIKAFGAYQSEIKNRMDADYNSPKFKCIRDTIEKGKYKPDLISNLCINIKSGFAAGKQDQSFDSINGVPHIRPLNINSFGELSLENTKRVPLESVNENDLCNHCDILFNNTNSTALVGKTALFELSEPCATSNHITRLVAGDRIEPGFLVSVFNALRSLGYFGMLSTNFNNQAGINTETLSAVKIPCPPKEIQLEIINEVTRRKDKALRLKIEAETEWQNAKKWFEGQLLGKQ